MKLAMLFNGMKWAKLILSMVEIATTITFGENIA